MSSTEKTISLYYDDESKDFTISGLTLEQIIVLFDMCNNSITSNMDKYYELAHRNSISIKNSIVLAKHTKNSLNYLLNSCNELKNELFCEVRETLNILELAVKQGKIKL